MNPISRIVSRRRRSTFDQPVYAYEPASVLVEVDWDKDQRAVDAQDRRLFNERKAGGFGGRVLKPGLLALVG